ncbi:hypothetical protein ABH909_002854 [Pseudomonas sp. BS3782 TE3695]
MNIAMKVVSKTACRCWRSYTRRFLIEMDQVVLWKDLIALIEPHYPKGDGGHPAYPCLAGWILQVINGYLGDRGLLLRQGTVVDATIRT